MLPRFDLPRASSFERFPSVRADDVTWHPEMVSLVLQRRDTEALKLYRARTGGSARESQRALLAVQKGEPMAVRKSGVSEGTSQEADLLNLLRSGDRAGAADLYRESTGASPGDSVEAVDRLAIRHSITRPGSGCLSMLVALGICAVVECAWMVGGG
ncbi:MAG: hypothetical protein NT069_21410 [Planctomycetota bacterium]|nr:hypothetical protein [Planctomycetota bacterium]